MIMFLAHLFSLDLTISSISEWSVFCEEDSLVDDTSMCNLVFPLQFLQFGYDDMYPRPDIKSIDGGKGIDRQR